VKFLGNATAITPIAGIFPPQRHERRHDTYGVVTYDRSRTLSFLDESSRAHHFD
jgi:hypothetical protein